MIFRKKQTALKQARQRDMRELKRQIELSKGAILAAQNHFEHVIDPTLIDCYILS